MSPAIKCPMCPKKFRWSVELSLHMHESHPGALGAEREALRTARRSEYVKRQEEREKAARKIVGDFEKRYGRSWYKGKP